jgi:alpha-beta hydrolase superfamily lysophospholipase
LLNQSRHDLPLFIYAHSLGGLVTIKLLLEKSSINVSGCIITSPLLGLSKNLNFNWIKKQFVHYLGNHLSDFIVNSQVNPTALTKRTKYMYTIF